MYHLWCCTLVNGGFSSWGEWADCPVTCGTGQRDRDRACTNPVPQHGGFNCSGSYQETQDCCTISCQRKKTFHKNRACLWVNVHAFVVFFSLLSNWHRLLWLRPCGKRVHPNYSSLSRRVSTSVPVPVFLLQSLVTILFFEDQQCRCSIEWSHCWTKVLPIISRQNLITLFGAQYHYSTFTNG